MSIGEMDRMTDAHIRCSLKNWAANQNPPRSGRGRLLLLANIASTTDHPIGEIFLNPHLNRKAAEDRLPQHANSFSHSLLCVLYLNMSPLRNIV